MRGLKLVLASAAVAATLACGQSASQKANHASADNTAGAQPSANANVSPAEALASGRLDAEIAQLEAQAEKYPDDDTARTAVAAAYVRRANALRDTGHLTEALRDYQTALRYNPDNEEAQLGVEQVEQANGAEPRADDGRPVTVPAKKP